ncbi:hypothetical protein [Halomonas cerina]|uniref:Drug/metabolite transporter (DMT)-like permease n=1 Tax=Halomonas cerina TaxID=447424 RepID=A0A839VI25_9GAMM|nr:hypothetical protein [Halomonas cerina]MBB3192244.1 drug/metabolite transporter (DMT)-like permease [Halomonas cerina]
MTISSARPVPLDRPLLGIAFMLAAGLLFVMLDTGVKWLGQDYSPIQVVWARYAGHMLVLAGYFLWLGLPRCRELMRTESLLGQGLRGLLLFGASTFAYLALRELPSPATYLGASLIIAAGLYLATRRN